jgi:formate dehydrogenase subunit gamma
MRAEEASMLRFSCLAAVRSAAAAIAFFGLLCAANGVSAQQGRDAPPLAGSPSGANPTAQAVSEQQLLQALGRLEGRVTIPDGKAGLLEQPQGRRYQEFHERILPWVSGILILGTILALAIFYLVRGSMELDERPTGVKVQRFNVVERTTHWLTATSFIVLALTGLNYIFGKRLLFPLLGPDAFATWSQWAKFAHNAFSWPFMLGLVLMIVFWLRDNLPDRYDLIWLRQMGGLFSHAHPPARRFNAGQKLVFWSVVIFGLTLTVTGLVMLFPFSALDINGMQVAQYLHASAGSILTSIIIFHIYVGTLLMRGAFAAMSTGEVDLAWARAHHSLWLEELQRGGTLRRPAVAAVTPAE